MDAKQILLKINPSAYINETSRDYALYVAENRGIPCVWDGLKDGQRKALYVLQKRAGEIKTVSLAGEMISRGLYIHGDGAAADSVGKMAAPYQNNLPLIKGIGNFGTKTAPKDIAAPRYTYVKKNNVSDSIMYPDSNIIPMVDNYDGSTKQPKHYLPLIPTVLLNGIEGMAPGFSTYILPRSVDDLIQATLDVLDLKMPTTLAPHYDYCGGDVANIGFNKWELFGGCTVLDRQTIHVTELCPGMLHEDFITKLEKLIDDKAIKDYLDNTKDHIDITVRFPRAFCTRICDDTGLERVWTEKEALTHLGLVKRVTERIVVVDWNCKTIKPYDTAEELVIHFVQQRFDFYIKRYENLLTTTKFERQYWDVLKACYDNDLPTHIKDYNNKAELVAGIKQCADHASIPYTEEQIDRVASLPTYRWTKDEYQKIIDKLAELQGSINEYDDLLSNTDKIWAVYRDEVAALQTTKFDIERD